MNADKYPVVIHNDELKLLGETKQFRMYECQLPEGAGCGILKIATSAVYNSLLDREAMLLQIMRSEAAQMEKEYAEEEYAKVKKDPQHLLRYEFCFPDLVDSFEAEDQGDRRVNILRFHMIEEDLGRLVPIEHITERDRVRVDPKTSAWMLGKTLKTLVFAHDQNISLENWVENILIERNEHYAILFDWSAAVIHVDGIPEEIARGEIAQAAQAVITALGGDIKTWQIPADPQDADGNYGRYLRYLAEGNEYDASRVHTRFYELVRSLWPERGFWPFTSYPIEERR